ncbi:CehA/McbA family metallohydrolase [Kitasatospora sp. NPDC088134]|uniref:CehA/McbA family metallohydrolase n=1 Tax=Kitasatospora sp. NPDC088134 TaxID=3364071 RepID=UPI0038176399
MVERWYRGDLHAHTVRSGGGELTPEQLVAEARAAGLDFLAVTEHNQPFDAGSWRDTGDLLIVPGQEVVTRTGHWLALGDAADRVGPFGAESVDRALGEVRAAGGLCVAAHPHAPYPGGELMFPLESFDAVEVWNGPWGAEFPWSTDNGAALAEWGRRLGTAVRAGAGRTGAGHRDTGRWQPAVGSSDAHLAGQLGTPQLVVRAPERSAAAILAAVRAGRSWIAESATVELEFTATAADRTALAGDRLATAGRPVEVAVRVSGVADPLVRFHTVRGRAHTAPAGADGTVRWTTDARESAFVRVELRHPDGRVAALGNPILLAD